MRSLENNGIWLPPLNSKSRSANRGRPGKDDEGKQQQFGYCTWFTPDDMEDITVMLHKPGFLAKSARQFQNVPWLATYVEVNLCRAGSPAR